MPIHSIYKVYYFSSFTKTRIEMSYELMAKHIKINPGFHASTFSKSHLISIEVSGLIDITDLDSNMKGR